MARMKATPEARAHRKRILHRLRLVQYALFPSHDGPSRMADSLGIPYRSWQNYSLRGNCINDIVLLRLLAHHGVSPRFLLYGTGPMFTHEEEREAIADRPVLMNGHQPGR